MKYLLIVLSLAALCLAGSRHSYCGDSALHKNDTTYLNFPNGKITVVHDSIYSVETWTQRTDTTRTEYYQQNNGLIIKTEPWRKFYIPD
jgi:hypothetical protein